MKRYIRNAGAVAICAALSLGVSTAEASDWGCQVLLCLANPGSPTQYQECVPPITKLWEALAKVPPDPFPTCDMADGNNGENYAKQDYAAYDPCPEGTSAASKGMTVAEGSKRPGRPSYTVAADYNITGGAGTSQPASCGAPGCSQDIGFNQGPLACLGNFVGSYNVLMPGQTPQQQGGYSVGVYDKVVWQPWQSPRVIRVYIDGKLHNSVHW